MVNNDALYYWGVNHPDRQEHINSVASSAWQASRSADLFDGDIGAYAAATGCDAYTQLVRDDMGIEVYYTVVVNRTALCILD